jgi:hypothetical protein
MMRTGQKVRLKAASPLKQRLGLPPEALGAVLCCYSVRRSFGTASYKLDVSFGPKLVVWGVPDDQFEAVDEGMAA